MRRKIYKLSKNLLVGLMAFTASIQISIADCEPPPPGPSGGDGSPDIHSTDPNAITGPEGFGSKRYVAPGEKLDYTVYFENISTATASAQEIRVTNPLSPDLDWSTFEMGEVTLGSQTELGLVGKKSANMEVALKGTTYQMKVTCTLNQTAGVVEWYLRIVDKTTEDGWPEKAEDGLLPPNNSKGDGEGHLVYSIKVKADAEAGSVIHNSATIIFDTNAPIETDPSWWNTVYTEEPDEVLEGEFDNRENTLSWADTDTASSYDLYIWEDGMEQPSEPTLNVTTTRYTLPEGFAEGNYHWQVVAKNPNGTSTSPIWDFTVSGEIPHPADTNEDYIIDDMELMDYATRWLFGDPNIPDEYLMWGANIWLTGGAYGYQADLEEPYCWIFQ